jgi:hypothetical protein
MRWLRSFPFVCLLALTACAAQVRTLPPYLEDCLHPVVDTSTNGGLARGLLAYRRALRVCNDDKAALREWHKE